MSVFFENEFKNESENEIKNESENRCIMLPEEVKGKGYFALTGSKLKAYVEKWLDGIDEERDFVEEILDYCKRSRKTVYRRAAYRKAVYGITGLPSTGKTTGLLQAIRKLAAYEKCVYISFDRKTDGDLDTLQQLLDRLNDDHKYVFIDEITCMKDFTNRIGILMDQYTSRGKRVVMSGTDSYAFLKVDRCWHIGCFRSISFMSYEEARRTTRMDFSSYLMSGGLYGTEKYKGTKGLWNYIKDSIVDNLAFSVRRNPIECSFADMSETELCQAVFLTMCIIVCSWEEDLQLDGLLDTIFTGERRARWSKIIGNLGQELGITFKRVERRVIEDILRMLENMEVVVVILNLHRDSYGAKYMITVPFLVNQIAWLIANHVVKTGEKRKEESVRQINEIALKSVVISHTAYHLWHKTCYYYRDDKTEVDLVLLDQEDLRLEELQASLVDINITNHADTAYEKGQRMKEVNPYFFAELVYGIDERIILYLGPTNKKKGLTNVMDFLESYQQRNIKTEKYLDEMEKKLMDEQKQ